MDVEDVLASQDAAQLANALDKGQAFDVAHRAAHFYDDDVGFGCFPDPQDALANLSRNVGDHLHGAAQIVAAPLFLDHVLEDLARGHVALTGQGFIDEALVVAEVEVGFRAVIRHKDFAVLIRAHGAGIDVDVRIELLNGDTDTPALEQPSDCRDGHPLADRRDYSAGYEDVLGNVPRICHAFAHFTETFSRRTCARHSRSANVFCPMPPLRRVLKVAAGSGSLEPNSCARRSSVWKRSSGTSGRL